MKVIKEMINLYEVCLTFKNNSYATFYINMIKNDTRLAIFSTLLYKKQNLNSSIIHKLYKKSSQK